MALGRRAYVAAKRPALLEMRSLTPDDLAVLKLPRGRSHNVRELRDSHHLVARLMAAGLRNDEVAERSGFSMGSIYRFAQDPAHQELVAQYRKTVNASYREEADEFNRILLSNRMKAERRIADRLDDDEATVTTRDLITISRDAADRTGYGKISMQVHKNAGMATAMEIATANAFAKSGRSPPMIEATATRSDDRSASAHPTAEPSAIDRRGL
jgi:hypothetical protein